jgi:hypothetical protein
MGSPRDMLPVSVAELLFRNVIEILAQAGKVEAVQMHMKTDSDLPRLR